uniref:Uncharacterized protein n=1 Tax=Panagrolaimus davidi TaxID=227884 RepID=A0A914PTA5_9BILA
MECSIPLETKYWTIDHGTLFSIPNSSFIEKINTDVDGIFTFNCKSENAYLHFGLQNLPEKFDYTITILGLTDLVKPDLNSSIQFSKKDLFNPKNMHLFVDQKLKISYNFFFYEKLESSKANEMRKFIHQKYNYIPETPIIPFSTLPKCPIVRACLNGGLDSLVDWTAKRWTRD